DLWEYNPANDIWTQVIVPITVPARRYGVSFSIGTKGYIGGGAQGLGSLGGDFWEWDQLSNTWSQKKNIPGWYYDEPFGFSISTKGYAINSNDTILSEFDPAINLWTQKGNFGPRRSFTEVGFSIG